MRLALALAAWTTAAWAQPTEFLNRMNSLPNGGGTLYLTFCTPAGWPCMDFKQEVWGQICTGSFADMYAKNHGGNVIFSRYTRWKCPGYVASEEGKKCCGYANGGEAGVESR